MEYQASLMCNNMLCKPKMCLISNLQYVFLKDGLTCVYTLKILHFTSLKVNYCACSQTHCLYNLILTCMWQKLLNSKSLSTSLIVIGCGSPGKG